MTKKKRHKNSAMLISDENAHTLFNEYIEKEKQIYSSSKMLFLASLDDVEKLPKKNICEHNTVYKARTSEENKRVISFYNKDDLTLLKGAPSYIQCSLEAMKQRNFLFKRRLDLHGMRLHSAQSVLMPFIQQAYTQGMHEVLLITGKGNNSPQGIAIIRESTTKWLTQYPLNLVVLGFTTPSRYSGGDGAIGVLLRPYDATIKILWHQYSTERE